jgi:hypothetical protein
MTLTDKNHLISAYESAWYLLNGKENNLIKIDITENGYFEITIHTGLNHGIKGLDHEMIKKQLGKGRMLKNLAVMTGKLLERQK